MPENVLETVQIPVRATFNAANRPPYPNGRRVLFAFSPNGGRGSADTREGRTQSGACEINWTPPRLEADEAGRDIRCRISVDGDAGVPPQEIAYTIWPKTINVAVTGRGASRSAPGAAGSSENLPPVRHATFTMRANGKTRNVVTDEDGRATNVEVPDAGALAITWNHPWTLDGDWERPDGRTWRGKLKTTFKASLLWPPAGLHRQWVNLPADGAKPEQGSDIMVDIVPTPPPPDDAKVYVLCELGSRNSARNDPRPRVYPPVSVADGERLEAVGTTKFKLTLNVRRGAAVASFRVELGKAGGDTLTIKVSSSDEVFEDAKVQDAVTITNWRKIFYQLTTPALPGFPEEVPHAVWGHVTSELAKVNIELEKFASKRLTVDEIGRIHPGLIVSGDRFDAPRGRNALVINLDERELTSKFGRLLTPGKGSLGCQIVLCDGFYKAKRKMVILDNCTTVAMAEKEVKQNWDALFKTGLNDGRISVDVKWGLVDPGTCPRDHAFVSSHPQSALLFAGGLVDLPADCIRWPADRKAVKIALPDAANSPRRLIGRAVGNTWPLVFCFYVRYAESLHALGQNYGSVTFLQLYSEDPPAPKCRATTFLHELGHALDQTIVPVSRVAGCTKGLAVGKRFANAREEQEWRARIEAGIATAHCVEGPPGVAAHPHSYVGKGHAGPHCQAGPTAGADTFVDERTGADVNGVGSCIMFGAGSSSDDSKAPAGFCADCRRFLKATAIDSVTRIWES